MVCRWEYLQKNSDGARQNISIRPEFNTVEAYGRILSNIMLRCNTTDKDQIITTLNTWLNDRDTVRSDFARNALHKIRKLDFTTYKARVWTACREHYERMIMETSLLYLCTQAACDPDQFSDRWMEFEEGCLQVMEFITDNGFDLYDFLSKLWDTLDRNCGKTNAFVLTGPSNCGKSTMFARPIEGLMRSVGRIPQMNSTSVFIFEGCYNKRLISVEECNITKANVEQCKLIFGGEPCQVNKKYVDSGIIIPPTPVIATSNQQPWLYCITEEEPLRNRMHYWQIGHRREWPEGGCKPIAPVVYAALLFGVSRSSGDEFDPQYCCDNVWGWLRELQTLQSSDLAATRDTFLLPCP